MQHSTSARRPWPRRLAAAAALCAALSWPFAGAGDTLQQRLQLCGTCHGENGNSKMERTPSLAGQPALFLTNQLILMRERLRNVEVMAPFVRDLSDADITALAEHYAQLSPEPSDEPVDRSLAARGAMLARELHCGSCHLPSYAGREQMPRLARQRIDYTIMSLKAYREGSRYGIDTSMNGVMHGVSDEDIRALAHFLATVP